MTTLMSEFITFNKEVAVCTGITISGNSSVAVMIHVPYKKKINLVDAKH